MSKKIITGLLATILLLGSSWTMAIGPEFSADMTMKDAKGKLATGKVFMKAGQKIRQEMIVEGQTSVTILRLDKKLSWTLLPNNQYMEVALPFDPQNPGQDSSIQYENKVIGNEFVNGYNCQVIQYTYKEQKYGILVQWVAAQLNFSVRYQTKDANGKITSTIDYTNIKLGNQPDSLFEVPAGYQKFSMNFKIPGM